MVGGEEWNIAPGDDEEPCPECATWRPRMIGAR